MKRPCLVNPSFWSPFKSIPVSPPVSEPVYLPQHSEVPEFISRPITRKELIQKNSFFLNLMGLVLIACISYFLYNIYLERKIFVEYLEYVKNNQEEYSGFF